MFNIHKTLVKPSNFPKKANFQKNIQAYISQWNAEFKQIGSTVRLKHAKDSHTHNSLSEQEHSVVDHILQNYGDHEEWELVQVVHKMCSEWKDPNIQNKSAILLSIKEIQTAIKNESTILPEDLQNESLNKIFAHIDSFA